MTKTVADIHTLYLEKYKNRIFGYDASTKEDGEVIFTKKHFKKFLKTSAG
jgi:hypothetical protein